MTEQQIKDIISTLQMHHIHALPNQPLKNYCHWKIGGVAAIIAEPASADQILKTYQIAKDNDVPLFVIGNGTNILFDDHGFHGIIIKIGSRYSKYTIQDAKVKAQSGVWGPYLAKNLATAGLSGLEHASGIPGNLGGLVYMNGGSLRRSIGEIITSVTIIDNHGEIQKLDKTSCCFSYRKSIFQTNKAIILGVEMELSPKSPHQIKTEMLEHLSHRKKSFPLKHPNCGSVFANDDNLYQQYGPPGKIIDQAGFKGLRFGDAMVSHEHGNFIINLGNATSHDIFALIKDLREKIYDLTNFWLCCEVRYLSPHGKCGPLHTFIDDDQN